MPKPKFKVVKCNIATGKRYSVFAGKEFMLEYKKGRIVNAPGIGVMCFHTEIAAKKFMDHSPWLTGEWVKKIIKVEPMCRATKVPFWMAGGHASSIRKYIRIFNYFLKQDILTRKEERDLRKARTQDYVNYKVIKGTVCYKKVKVLT